MENWMRTRKLHVPENRALIMLHSSMKRSSQYSNTPVLQHSIDHYHSI